MSGLSLQMRCSFFTLSIVGAKKMFGQQPTVGFGGNQEQNTVDFRGINQNNEVSVKPQEPKKQPVKHSRKRQPKCNAQRNQKHDKQSVQKLFAKYEGDFPWSEYHWDSKLSNFPGDWGILGEMAKVDEKLSHWSLNEGWVRKAREAQLKVFLSCFFHSKKVWKESFALAKTCLNGLDADVQHKWVVEQRSKMIEFLIKNQKCYRADDILREAEQNIELIADRLTKGKTELEERRGLSTKNTTKDLPRLVKDALKNVDVPPEQYKKLIIQQLEKLESEDLEFLGQLFEVNSRNALLTKKKIDELRKKLFLGFVEEVSIGSVRRMLLEYEIEEGVFRKELKLKLIESTSCKVKAAIDELQEERDIFERPPYQVDDLKQLLRISEDLLKEQSFLAKLTKQEEVNARDMLKQAKRKLQSYARCESCKKACEVVCWILLCAVGLFIVYLIFSGLDGHWGTICEILGHGYMIYVYYVFVMAVCGFVCKIVCGK